MQPIFTYKKSAYLDALPLYNLWDGSDDALALARKIVESDAYIFKSYGFPNGTGIEAGVSTNVFTPRQTFEGSMLVEPFAYVVSITAEYAPMEAGNIVLGTPSAGFRMQVFDKGARMFMFDRTFGKDHSSWGVMRDLTGGTGPRGPYFLRSPFIVLPTGDGAGQLSIEITSLEQTANQFIQVCFACAVPKSGGANDPRKLIMRSPSSVVVE